MKTLPDSSEMWRRVLLEQAKRLEIEKRVREITERVAKLEKETETSANKPKEAGKELDAGP
jgi:hypothetical protein